MQLPKTNILELAALLNQTGIYIEFECYDGVACLYLSRRTTHGFAETTVGWDIDRYLKNDDAGSVNHLIIKAMHELIQKTDPPPEVTKSGSLSVRRQGGFPGC